MDEDDPLRAESRLATLGPSVNAPGLIDRQSHQPVLFAHTVMLPIVQFVAYVPFAAVLLFTTVLWVAPPFGSGHISHFPLDALLTGMSWMLTFVGVFAAIIGALVFRNMPLAIMFVITVPVAGHLTGRDALLPIPQTVGMTVWCVITTAVLIHLVTVDMAGRHMFWTRWND